MNFGAFLALDDEPRLRLNSVAPLFTQTEATAAVGTDEASLAPFVNRIRSAVPAARRTSPRPSSSWPAATPPTSRARTSTVDGGTTASTGQPHVEA